MPGVIAGIITAGKLVAAIQTVGSVIPEPPSDITGKHRWVTVTVFNQTQFSVVYLGISYFNSGRFWTAPTNVQPFSSMTFSGCDSDGSFLTGVSGGATFQIQMPLQGGGYETQDFSVGFTNPQSGAIKASAEFISDPSQVETDATPNSMQSTSATYTGLNTSGASASISFLLTSSPGQEASVTLTEQLVQ